MGKYLRVALNGVMFCFFGIGAVFLGSAVFPWCKLRYRDPSKRQAAFRNAVTASFRLLNYFCSLTGTYKVDTKALTTFGFEKGAVYIANHPSLIDYVIITSCFPGLICVVKDTLTRNFFVKGVISGAGYLSNADGANLAEECERVLSQGNSVLIFPEGTRSSKNGPIKFNHGFARLAIKAKAPVQPVFIHLSEEFLSKTHKWNATTRHTPRYVMELGQKYETKELADTAAVARALSKELEKKYNKIINNH